ncbi:DUF2612 domain-containing protein [Serratia fonticola]|uniref:DUF2612 domain-containing protein n=1 Tax=Serratia fonticola TaxID=47917 RepID=UPI000E0FF35D|nr:DUF2612 domain-containing protein [Serratia fonticola]QIP93150.1 putative bacteriophage protein [Serratia fonticola]RDL26883.1 uncharacterized protein DUF2612 [Serratia fonticola]
MSETKYQRLITSYHKHKPKFYDHISLITQPFVNIQNALTQQVTDFDLDFAIGVQLDAVGLWIGIGRTIKTPIEGVYFSLDIEGVGLDQGVWQGEFEAGGLTVLDDDTYRTILRAKIAANHWDGTTETLSDVYQAIFPDQKTRIFAVDNFDMTMSVYITGENISAVMKAVIAQGYLDVKPSTVGIKSYIITSEPGRLFGFDIENDFIAGFDTGSWGIQLNGENNG